MGNDEIGRKDCELLTDFDCGVEVADGTVNQEGRELMADVWSDFSESVLAICEGVLGNDIVDVFIERLVIWLDCAFDVFIEPTRNEIVLIIFYKHKQT